MNWFIFILASLFVLVCFSSRVVEIVFVTDTHSWVHGHRHPDHEPASDATYGNLFSFIFHLKKMADLKKKDLYFFDNGDIVDGTGVSGATPLNGELVFRLMKRLQFDALNIGNHELYLESTLSAMRSTEFISHWNGTYLTSNTLFKTTQLHVGTTFALLKGKHGSSLLVFGFLYDMIDHCESVVVEKVATVVTQKWFIEALQTESYDAIVVMAHMHVTDPLIYLILNKIREVVGSQVIVQFLTGHSHIRAFHQFDVRASSLEAGKFFDTIGFISLHVDPELLSDQHSNVSSQNIPPIIFDHKYLNSNLEEMMLITNTNRTNFHTAEGRQIDSEIESMFSSLCLDKTIWCSPQYYDVEIDLSSPNSLWKLYTDTVVPVQLFLPAYNISQVLIQSTGSFRYDLYEGPTVVDDFWTVAPFCDGFFAISSLFGYTISKLYGSINGYGSSIHDRALRSPIKPRLPRYIIASMESPLDQDKQYDVLCVQFDCPYFVKELEKMLSTPIIISPFRRNECDTTIWLGWAEGHHNNTYE